MTEQLPTHTRSVVYSSVEADLKAPSAPLVMVLRQIFPEQYEPQKARRFPFKTCTFELPLPKGWTLRLSFQPSMLEVSL